MFINSSLVPTDGGCISSYSDTEPGAGGIDTSSFFFGVFRKYLASSVPSKSPVMNVRIENVSSDTVREGMSASVLETSVIRKGIASNSYYTHKY